MAWVKLDDSMPDDPRFVDLSDAAFALHVRGLCYAGRHLTDGAIPATALKRLRGRPPVLAELETPVECRACGRAHGAWTRTATGWQIEDYHAEQPSREKVLQQRKAANDRLKRHRDAKRAAREAAAAAGDAPPGPRDVQRERNAVSPPSETASETRCATGGETLAPSRPGTTYTQSQNVHTAAPARRVAVEDLAVPEFRVAMAIAHQVQEQHPTAPGEWASEFKARCVAQGWNYAHRGGPHERPLVDRALEAVEQIRKARAIANAPARPRPTRRERRAAGGRS